MATNHLHVAVSDLRTRIRDLESALSGLHLARTGSYHTLLKSPDDGDDVDEEDDLNRPFASLRLQSDTFNLATASDKTLRYYGYAGGGFNQSVHVRVLKNVHLSMNSPIRQHSQSMVPSIRDPLPGIDPELARVVRYTPFPPFPAIESAERRLRVHLPDPAMREQFLHIFHGEIGDAVLPAFTREYVQQTVIPRALYGEGRLAVAALSTLFALMSIGALFMVPGPGEAPEVGQYERLSFMASCALGSFSTPFLEAIECDHARCYLDLLRQGTLEESRRAAIAVSCQQSFIVSIRLYKPADICID
jgi:hypothetical protein